MPLIGAAARKRWIAEKLWKMTKWISSTLRAITVAVVVLLVVFARLPDETPLGSEIENAGHAPAFGVLALALLGLSKDLFRRKCLDHYRIAIIGTLFLAIATELLQFAHHGYGEVGDVVRDVAGGIAFLGFFWTVDKSAGPPKFVIPVRSGAICILITAFIPAMLWGLALIHRNASFPTIMNFDSVWDSKFCSAGNAQLEIMKGRARITFHPAQYSGFHLSQPYPDWSGYHFFTFTIFSELPDTVNLVLRIHDRHHNQAYHDRFNLDLSIHNGRNEISIPLEMIRGAPGSRLMDMSAIRGIGIFAVKPASNFSLYISEFRCAMQLKVQGDFHLAE